MPRKHRSKARDQALLERKREVVQRETERTASLLATRTEATITAYRGPLPAPETLRAFDEVVPGLARQLTTLFDDQARHRMYLERKVVDSDVSQTRLGSVLGFVIVIAAVTAGTWLVSQGHSTEGVAAIIAAIASLAGVFVYGTRSRQQERAEKNQQQNRLRGR